MLLCRVSIQLSRCKRFSQGQCGNRSCLATTPVHLHTSIDLYHVTPGSRNPHCEEEGRNKKEERGDRSRVKVYIFRRRERWSSNVSCQNVTLRAPQFLRMVCRNEILSSMLSFLLERTRLYAGPREISVPDTPSRLSKKKITSWFVDPSRE